MEPPNNTNQDFTKGLISLLGISAIVLANLSLGIQQVIDKPRQIQEYQQRLESQGKVFDIQRFYNSIKNPHHYRG